MNGSKQETNYSDIPKELNHIGRPSFDVH